MVKSGSTLFDLVEREAARALIPRLQLWEDTVKALITGDLPAINLLDHPEPSTTPKMSLGRGWLRNFLRAIQRGSDPSSFRHILNQIVVQKVDFEKWGHKKSHGRRGPMRGSTGFQASDRKLFPLISSLIESGAARSPNSAALKIDAKKIAGPGTPENKARRLAALYRKERAS
jgi:hypothetical protein